MMLPADLDKGYREFSAGRLREEQARFTLLAEEGQRPRTMIIGCCDSRVSPENIFNARPGEMFVVRNVANLVPSFDPDGAYHGTSAALEFAVQGLRVRQIVVLGHGRCGGIRAFAGRLAQDHEPLSSGDFIGKWISQLDEVEATVPEADRTNVDDYAALLEVASLRAQLRHLRTYPCVQILESRGKLTLHACHFAIATGLLSVLDEASGKLVPAADASPGRPIMFAEGC